MVRNAQISSLLASRCLKNLLGNPNATPEAVLQARSSFVAAKANLQKTVRSAKFDACYTRDSKLFSILGQNPSEMFKSIKKVKSNNVTKIQKLNVGNKTYTGDLIPDGFYSSL